MDGHLNVKEISDLLLQRTLSGKFLLWCRVLCFSCDCLKYWLILSLTSDEEQLTPYAQWTTRRNYFKFRICGCTGPLVREFCNSLWSKAIYLKYILILGKLKGKQGSCFVRKTIDISLFPLKQTMDFAKYLSRGDEFLSRERKIVSRQAIFVPFD